LTPTKMKTVRLGTRGSELALRQADLVAGALQKAAPDIEVQCRVIRTRGDAVLDTALSLIGDKGLFTAELEAQLLDGSIDIAVHSLKDMPTELAEGLCIGAVLKREDPRDALLSPAGHVFEALPGGAVLGTSSLRRAAQIQWKRPDIRIVPLRGNVGTRIRKMHEQQLDGIVLAYAGLRRLGLEHLIADVLPPETIMPAAGQGAIAVETRAADSPAAAILAGLDDAVTRLETRAERAFLQTLHGGCQVPIACTAVMRGERMTVRGLVALPDGSTVYASEIRGDAGEALSLGRDLARRLLGRGARKIIEAISPPG